MNIARVIKENKVSLIVIIVLWLILTLVFVAPLAYAISYAGQSGAFNFTVFIETFVSSLISFNAITKVFSAITVGIFFKTLGIFKSFKPVSMMLQIFHLLQELEHSLYHVHIQ